MFRRLLIGMTVVIALTAIGVAWATIPSKDGTINACYMKATGIVRIIDPDTQQCHRWETPISWNQAGPQGLPGPQGPGGVSGYEQKSHQEWLAAGTYKQVSVRCSAGKKVLGGGFDVELPTEVKVYSSQPSDGQGNFIDNGWNVFALNSGPYTRQVTVSAICARVS